MDGEANVALIIVYFPIRGYLLRRPLSHQRPEAGASRFPISNPSQKHHHLL